jgi:SET domain
MFADDKMTKEIERANARTAGSTEIRHVGEIGWGVFALKDYEVGDVVMHPTVISAIPTDDDVDDDDHADVIGATVAADDDACNKEEKKEDSDESSANNAIIPMPMTTPTLHTIQLGWSQHVLTNLPTRFMNHMCGTPSVGILGSSVVAHNSAAGKANGIYDFVALRRIQAGDEITFDYETTEFEMLNGGFICTCVSPICRGHLRGFKYSGDAVMKVFDKKHIAPYLLGFKSGDDDSMNVFEKNN